VGADYFREPGGREQPPPSAARFLLAEMKPNDRSVAQIRGHISTYTLASGDRQLPFSRPIYFSPSGFQYFANNKSKNHRIGLKLKNMKDFDTLFRLAGLPF
jgi:hypothetical protein